MPANVTCTECGMELEVLEIMNYTLFGEFSNYYHLPDLNEHMQLHEGGDHV